MGQKRKGEKEGKKEIWFSNVQNMLVTVFCVCVCVNNMSGWVYRKLQLRPGQGGHLVLVLDVTWAYSWPGAADLIDVGNEPCVDVDVGIDRLSMTYANSPSAWQEDEEAPPQSKVTVNLWQTRIIISRSSVSPSSRPLPTATRAHVREDNSSLISWGSM